MNDAKRYRIARGTRRQLIEADYGAWEDEGRPDEIPPPVDRPDDPNGGYFPPILRRFKTRLEIRNEWEAATAAQELRYFASSSGFCWWTPQFGEACVRLAHEIDADWDVWDGEFPATLGELHRREMRALAEYHAQKEG